MTIEKFTNLMKALSDSNRVRALLALQTGELCVCQLIELFELAPSTVSKHLSILKQAQLVTSRKSGRWIYYRLAEDSPVTGQKLLELALTELADTATIMDDKKRLATIMDCDRYELCKRQRGEKCC